MRPFSLSDTPEALAGSAFAVALGRAVNKGNISQDGIMELFRDFEDVLRILDNGERLEEDLPNFVGDLVQMLHYGLAER